MFKILSHSLFIIFICINSFAQEVVKPLSSNINYLYGDLKVKTEETVNYANRPTSLSLPFLDDFSYSPYQAYPLQSLWSDSTTYINSGYAIAPLSIGVATFDGLNKFGYPYTPNLANSTAALPADTLTSKPINLMGYQASDSIALTFYYQARGNGESPEISDSLLLDFYNVISGKWERVWFMRGNTSPNTNDTVFKRGFVRVDSAYFLQDGFKFRFRNKANTAGNFDHWHLDYVYLNTNRHILADTNYFDFAFGYIPSSFLKNYSAMPWRQYTTSDMADKNTVFIRNNGILNGNLTYTNNFYNNTNVKIYGYNGGATPNPPIFKYGGWLNAPSISNPSYTYTFPPMTGPGDYKIQHILYSQNPDFIKNNDTVLQHQIFSNYYAFDDGSAEGGYYVSGVGAKIAAKFTTHVNDTLNAVKFYFDPAETLSLAQLYNFKINVWQDGGNGPSNTLLYTDQVSRNPFYPSTGYNTFSGYQLETPLILPPGTYYIGLQQQVASGIIIGFDKNTNHSSSLYYDNGNGWTQSAIYGSIMIRPIFGVELPLSVKENSTLKNNLFFVYPNPSSNNFTIHSNQIENASYTIINSIGQKITEGKIENFTQNVTTQNLSDGIYFLILKVNEQLVKQYKIIIQH